MHVVKQWPSLVNINFTVLAHAYVLYARALQSRIRGGTFACLKKWYGDAHHCKKWYGVRRTSRTFYAAPDVGLETCYMSALNARAKRSGHSVLREFRTSQVSERCCLRIIYGILYLKDRSGSCGTILEKPWGL